MPRDTQAEHPQPSLQSVADHPSVVLVHTAWAGWYYESSPEEAVSVR
jgi:hypothetical protein